MPRVGRTTQRRSTSEKLRAMRPGSRRRERRHHVLGRAQRVVLVPVLDVGDAAHVVKPGRELDARCEVRASCSSLRPGLPLRRDVDEEIAELVLHRVPVELDVVVAVDDRQTVARGDEVGERVEDDAMPRSDGGELEARVVGAVAEAVLALLVARSLGELTVARQNAHSDEVDEVPCDDQAPALSGAWAMAVVRQAGSRGRRRRARSGGRLRA